MSRLAVVDSHVIAYRTPFYQRLAQEPGLDLHVHYYSNRGAQPYFDEHFHRWIEWEVPRAGDYEFSYLRNWAPHRAGFHFLSFFSPGILSTLWRSRYDAIVVHGHMYANDWITMLGAWLTRTPVLYRSESSLTYDREVRRPRRVRAVKRMLLRTLFRHLVSGFLAIGTLNREFYLAYGVSPERIFDVPYAVDNDYFAAEAHRWRGDRDELRRELGYAPGDVVFLYAAKLVAQKAPLELLRAFRDSGPPAAAGLIMVGSGELLDQAKQFAADNGLPNVVFPGFVNVGDLARYYAISDVLVRPDGLYQGDWGLTVNEAMAAGLAVLASDRIGAVEDLVVDGDNGRVFRFGDPAALAEAIMELASDPQAVARMGTRSSDRIANWSFEEGTAGIQQALSRCGRNRLQG